MFGKSAALFVACPLSSSLSSFSSPHPQFHSLTTTNSTASSPYDVIIELDKQIYNPGDVVSGEVLLHLQRPLACDRICARLFGSARVFFTEILKTPGPNFGKNRAYEQEVMMVDQQVELWKAPNNDVGQRNEEGKEEEDGGDASGKKELVQTASAKVPSKSLEEILRHCNPNAIRFGQSTSSNAKAAINSNKSTPGFGIGRHQLHFAFKLPLDQLHTSFDARNSAGSVRYHILVQAFNNGFNCLRRKLLFPVVCPKRLDDANWMACAMQPVLEKGNDKKELLRVELQMEKRGYVPGEPLVGSIKIENNTAKSVKWMSLRIVQHTVCIATRPEFGTHQSEFETSAMGLPVHKIPSGQTLTLPIRYYIPTLVPEINVPGCIESEHFLRLDVGNKRGIAVELTTPLLIGTHPTPPILRKPRQNGVDGKGTTGISMLAIPPIGAPPLYGEQAADGSATMENVPPPSYAQSVAGMSSVPNGVNGDEAKGMAHQQQHEHYAGPLCYHYNFGFNQEDGQQQNNANDDAVDDEAANNDGQQQQQMRKR